MNVLSGTGFKLLNLTLLSFLLFSKDDKYYLKSRFYSWWVLPIRKHPCDMSMSIFYLLDTNFVRWKRELRAQKCNQLSSFPCCSLGKLHQTKTLKENLPCISLDSVDSSYGITAINVREILSGRKTLIIFKNLLNKNTCKTFFMLPVCTF